MDVISSSLQDAELMVKHKRVPGFFLLFILWLWKQQHGAPGQTNPYRVWPILFLLIGLAKEDASTVQKLFQ